jgi:chloride channel protein, CIC family
MSSVVSRIRSFLRSRGSTAFLAASLLLGVLVGAGAAVLVRGMELVAHFVGETESLFGLGKWIFLISIPLGLLAAWLLNRWLGPDVSGGGVSETMVGLNLEAGYLRTRLVGAKIVATAATLGTGGSGGREGPIVLIGGALGSSLARYTRFGIDQVKSLVAAGAGAGIGASFNAPIAGMMFALEVVLSSFAIRHISAIVVTSVAAAVTTHALVGEETFLRSPAYELTDPRQLVLYALLAVLAVLFGTFFLRVLERTAITRVSARIPGWVLPVLMGVAVGIIGLWHPETLGTGQQFLTQLLVLRNPGDFVWWSLFTVAALKAITAAFTRKGGGSAGTFMPALVIGGAVGAGFAILIDPLWGFSRLDPGAFALVGMAAALAATARAPLTAVILVFEITGGYGLVLPLMLAAALATLIGDRIHPESAYTMSLARKGIRMPKSEDIDLLDTVDVREVMSEVDVVATPGMLMEEAERLLDGTRHHGMPVVRGQDLVGVISVADLEQADGVEATTTVGEQMSPHPITVTPDLPVSVALARMASLGLGRLPVVADDDPKRLVGMFRRESVVKAYHHALGLATGREMYRDRVRVRAQPGAVFFELLIRRGSMIVGRQVKDIHWPDRAILVSIRRGSSVLIPHGDTVFEVGDTITVFGTGESREDVGFLIEPGRDATGEWQPSTSGT